jgi:hypothetical protein
MVKIRLIDIFSLLFLMTPSLLSLSLYQEFKYKEMEYETKMYNFIKKGLQMNLFFFFKKKFKDQKT